MTKFRFLLVLLAVSLLWSGPLSVHAQEPSPAASSSAPLPPDAPSTPQASPQRNLLHLPALKAVIVVGPLDGGSTPGPVTRREINNAELAAGELEANGVSVSRFYSPNTSWTQIQAAANGAQFFIYRGHGIYWGDLPNPPVGGIELNERIFSNDELRAGLKLAPNAIVMIYSCFSSGSSDTDKASITLAEARRRVDEYSAPYFDLGASAVFTSWYGDAFQMYVRNLFQGMTLGQSFKSFYDFDPAMANLGVHPSRSGLDFWLEYENWNPYPIPPYQYDSSLVGKSTATLESLFLAPLMQLSGREVSLMVKPNSSAKNYPITVNSSLPYSFDWNAGDGVNWINIAPAAGQSGSAFTIQVLPGATVGTYHADVTVSTTDPLVINKTEQVHVHLTVTDTIYKVFIPTARR